MWRWEGVGGWGRGGGTRKPVTTSSLLIILSGEKSESRFLVKANFHINSPVRSHRCVIRYSHRDGAISSTCELHATCCVCACCVAHASAAAMAIKLRRDVIRDVRSFLTHRPPKVVFLCFWSEIIARKRSFIIYITIIYNYFYYFIIIFLCKITLLYKITYT